jgi:C4-type Zn-finger protein
VAAAMADVRECPLCGATMRLKISETVAQIPGTPKAIKMPSREWICPECDYFEEDDQDKK